MPSDQSEWPECGDELDHCPGDCPGESGDGVNKKWSAWCDEE